MQKEQKCRKQYKHWKQLAIGAIVVGTLAPLVLGLGSRAQNSGMGTPTRYVWLEREAVLIQSPQVVADAYVNSAAWAPDGHHIVAYRTDMSNVRAERIPSDTPPLIEMSVVLWNATLKHAFTLWKHTGLPQDVRPIVWLPNSQIGVIRTQWMEISMQPDAAGVQKPVMTTHAALLFVDSAREQVHEVTVPADAQFEVSPTKPQLLLAGGSEGVVHIMDKSGSMGPAISLPKKEYGVSWLRDGAALYQFWSEKAPDAVKRTVKYARIDLDTSAVTMLEKLPEPIAAQKPVTPQGYVGPLHVKQTVQMLREGGAIQRTHPLWLESEFKSEPRRALLCPDGADALISPRGDAALYLSQGIAWVTPLGHASREEFTRALKAVAISNAKQAGLALIMYSQDYDEILPAANDRLGDQIFPYLKNSEITDGLNYTYSGGPLANIQNPSTTVLGTYPGPGGAAIIYADGHVVWKDN